MCMFKLGTSYTAVDGFTEQMSRTLAVNRFAFGVAWLSFKITKVYRMTVGGQQSVSH